MGGLLDFFSANRNELLMTAFIILGIQLSVRLGGYMGKRRNMHRVDEPEKSDKE